MKRSKKTADEELDELLGGKGSSTENRKTTSKTTADDDLDELLAGKDYSGSDARKAVADFENDYKTREQKKEKAKIDFEQDKTGMRSLLGEMSGFGRGYYSKEAVADIKDRYEGYRAKYGLDEVDWKPIEDYYGQYDSLEDYTAKRASSDRALQEYGEQKKKYEDTLAYIDKISKPKYADMDPDEMRQRADRLYEENREGASAYAEAQKKRQQLSDTSYGATTDELMAADEALRRNKAAYDAVKEAGTLRRDADEEERRREEWSLFTLANPEYAISKAANFDEKTKIYDAQRNAVNASAQQKLDAVENNRKYNEAQRALLYGDESSEVVEKNDEALAELQEARGLFDNSSVYADRRLDAFLQFAEEEMQTRNYKNWKRKAQEAINAGEGNFGYQTWREKLKKVPVGNRAFGNPTEEENIFYSYVLDLYGEEAAEKYMYAVQRRIARDYDKAAEDFGYSALSAPNKETPYVDVGKMFSSPAYARANMKNAMDAFLKTADAAGTATGLKAAANTVTSGLENIFGGLIGTIPNFISYEVHGDINPNVGLGNKLTRTASNRRRGAGEAANELFNNITIKFPGAEEEIPLGQTITGIVDSTVESVERILLAKAATGGISKVLGGINPAWEISPIKNPKAFKHTIGAVTNGLMGTSVFNDTVIEGVREGKKLDDVVRDGLVQASIEAITEQVSVEMILANPARILSQKAKKAFLRMIISGSAAGLAEGSEEVAADLLGYLYDVLQYGEEGELYQAYLSYLGDATDEESKKVALRKVICDKTQQTIVSFFAGAASGVAMAGPLGVYNEANYAKTKKALTTDSITLSGGKRVQVRSLEGLTELVERAGRAESGSELYKAGEKLRQQMAQMVEEGKSDEEILRRLSASEITELWQLYAESDEDLTTPILERADDPEAYREAEDHYFAAGTRGEEFETAWKNAPAKIAESAARQAYEEGLSPVTEEAPQRIEEAAEPAAVEEEAEPTAEETAVEEPAAEENTEAKDARFTELDEDEFFSEAEEEAEALKDLMPEREQDFEKIPQKLQKAIAAKRNGVMDSYIRAKAEAAGESLSEQDSAVAAKAIKEILQGRKVKTSDVQTILRSPAAIETVNEAFGTSLTAKTAGNAALQVLDNLAENAYVRNSRSAAEMVANAKTYGESGRVYMKLRSDAMLRQNNRAKETLDGIDRELQRAYLVGQTDGTHGKYEYLTKKEIQLMEAAGVQDRTMAATRRNALKATDAGLVEKGNFDEAVEAELDKAAKTYGVRVHVVETLGGADGLQAGADIYISKDSTDPVFEIERHEFTHRMQDISPKEYIKYRNRAYKAAGIDAVELMNQYNAFITESGADIELVTIEGALDEIAAKYAQKLDDAKLAKVTVKEDAKHATKLTKALDTFRERVSRMTRDFWDSTFHTWDNALRAEHAYEDLAKQAAKDVENLTSDSGEAENGKGRLAVSDQALKAAAERYDEYDKPITAADIHLLREIIKAHNGEHVSINNFTSEDIEKAQKWAYKFWRDLGERSPFFRAWFGDWRQYEDNPETDAIIIRFGYGEHLPINTKKRTVKNNDMQKFIDIDDDIVGDSLHYASQNGDKQKIEQVLGRIDEIVENAILLDTQISDPKKANKKRSTSFMHILYAPITINSAPFLVKLVVEEYDLDSKSRGYNVQRIKMSSLQAAQFSELTRKSWKSGSSAKDGISIAQLYSLVKTFDKNFRAGKSVNPAMLNEDGTPKEFYHGTDADFDAFDMSKGRANMDIQGAFFSPWEEEAKGYGGKVGAYYLSIQNPAPEGVAYKALNRFKGQNGAGIKAREYLESLGYDGVVNYDEVIAFHPEQIKAVDNIGTFDKGEKKFRYSISDKTLAEQKAAAEKEAKRQAELADYYKSQLKLATDYRMDPAGVLAIANKFMKEYGMPLIGDKKSVQVKFLHLSDAIEDYSRDQTEEKYERMMGIARELAEYTIYEQTRSADEEMWLDAKKALRTTKMYLPEDLHNDLTGYEGYQDFRKRNFGKLRLTKDGRSVDSVYAELREKYPGLFPADIQNPADQLLRMADVASVDVSPKWVNVFGDNKAEEQRAIEAYAGDLLEQLYGEGSQKIKSAIKEKSEALKDSSREYYREKMKEWKQTTGRKMDERLQEYLQKKAEQRKQDKQDKDNRRKLLKAAQRLEKLEKKMLPEQREEIREVLGNLDTVSVSITGVSIKNAAELEEWYKEAKKNGEIEQNDKIESAIDQLHTIQKTIDGKTTPEQKKEIREILMGLEAEGISATGGTVADLLGLEEWYYNKLNNDPDFLPVPRIEKAIARIRKTQIAELTDDEVEQYYKAVRTTLDAMENILAQRRFDRHLLDFDDERTVDELQEATVLDIQNARAASTGKFGKFIDSWITDEELSPIRFFRRVTGYNENDPMMKVIRQFDKAQTERIDYQLRAVDAFRPWMEDRAYMETLSGKNADVLNLQGYQITRGELISLYLHSLNTDNEGHIRDGGLTIPNAKLLMEGETEEAYDNKNEVPVRITPSYLKEFCRRNMNAKDMAYAKAIHEYFNVTSKEVLNKASRLLLGYDIAEVENYFPINTDDRFITREFESIKYDGSMESYGSLKERTESKNPLMLRDVNDVLQQYIRIHGNYGFMAVPMRNFNRLYNGKQEANAENEEGKRVQNLNIHSVSDQLGRSFGVQGKQYVEKLMDDINGVREKKGKAARVGSKIRSRYAGAKLMLNLAVAMKQVASFPTAGSVVGARPLVETSPELVKCMVSAFTNQKYIKEVMEKVRPYTPLLSYRALGYSSQELGDMAKLNTKIPEKLNWIQGMDIACTAALWKTSENYVKENFKAFEVGSEGYYKKVAEIYNKVLEETQPDYTIMQRPQILRTNNEAVKGLVMFKTQLFQNFNILYDAAGEYNARKRAVNFEENEENLAALEESKKTLVRAISSQAVAALTITAMQMARNLLWRRKKYKDENGDFDPNELWKVGIEDFASSIAGTVLFGPEIYSWVDSQIRGTKYYKPEDVVMSSVGDMIGAIERLRNIIVHFKDKTAFQIVHDTKDLIMDSAELRFGIPANNVWNLVSSVAGDMMEAIGGEYGEMKAQLLFVDDVVKKTDTGNIVPTTEGYKMLYRAARDGEVEDFSDMRDYMISRGVDPETIEKKMKKMSKEHLKESAEYKQKSDTLENGIAGKLPMMTSADELASKMADAVADYAAEVALYESSQTAGPEGGFETAWIEKCYLYADGDPKKAAQYIELHCAASLMHEYEENGETISRAEQIYNYMTGMDLTDEEFGILFEEYYAASATREVKEGEEEITVDVNPADLGMTNEQYYGYYVEYGERKLENEKTYDAVKNKLPIDTWLDVYAFSGKHKKDEVIEYIDGLNVSKAQKDEIYLTLGYAASALGTTPWQ